MNQVPVKVLCAFASGVLLLASLQARAKTVVTDNVVSQTRQTQNNVPVTFGQVFRIGDVPRGATVTATLHGQPVALQVDGKATHPEGSLRHAVLTVIVPSLPGNAKLPLTLSTAAAPTATGRGEPVSLSQLLATSYNAKVTLDIRGTNYTADARALLQAANNANACKPWDRKCSVWLSGPQTSEWVVNGPVTKADGTTNPDLRIYFAVRAYAGTAPGTVGEVRTDIIVENSFAFTPQAQPQYTATLTSGTATYTSPTLTQYTATRWHKVAQAAIGPLPRWTSVYIIDPDLRAYNWMLANTDALGAYDIHFRDAATGWPVSIQDHPNITTAAWAAANSIAHRAMTGSAANQAKITAYRRDLLPNCVNNDVVKGCKAGWYGTGSPTLWDNAHQPSQAFVPYMVTGSYYYMSELAFRQGLGPARNG